MQLTSVVFTMTITEENSGFGKNQLTFGLNYNPHNIKTHKSCVPGEKAVKYSCMRSCVKSVVNTLLCNNVCKLLAGQR